MKLFSELAKRYDLTFTGLKINGSDKKELQIFKEDIDKFERVLARLHNVIFKQNSRGTEKIRR